tara:strand:- start:31 stop:540 length:510 start_codon:yes stop_codon:yes gene_type:complete
LKHRERVFLRIFAPSHPVFRRAFFLSFFREIFENISRHTYGTRALSPEAERERDRSIRDDSDDSDDSRRRFKECLPFFSFRQSVKTSRRPRLRRPYKYPPASLEEMRRNPIALSVLLYLRLLYDREDEDDDHREDEDETSKGVRPTIQLLGRTTTRRTTRTTTTSRSVS